MRPVDRPETDSSVAPAPPEEPTASLRPPQDDRSAVPPETAGVGAAARRTVLRSLAVAGAGAGLAALAHPTGSRLLRTDARSASRTRVAPSTAGSPGAAAPVTTTGPAGAARTASVPTPERAVVTTARTTPTTATAPAAPVAPLPSSAGKRAVSPMVAPSPPAATASANPPGRVAPLRTGSLVLPAVAFSGFAVVAEATPPTASGVFVADPALHLLRRCTFGPRPGDLAAVRQMGIDAWLSRQLNHTRIPDQAGRDAWALFPLAGATADVVQATTVRYSWDAMVATAMATLGRQIFSDRQLYEQVVDVFANHLHVAIPGEQWDTSPAYVGDVIRPFAMGRYRDMLLAAMRHPAMLQYLNNDVSTWTHVNENLGRELLELHTVGAGAGYSETDVVSSAKALTGRSADRQGHFTYRSADHWVGPLTVMGWSSANSSAKGGLAVGDAYLSHLANHPATGRTIARKLAVRFVSDQPPAALLDRMTQSYLDHDTDIRAVLVTLFQSPEFWASVGQKSRRPLEDLVGAARVLDMRPGPTSAGLSQTLQTCYWVVRSNGHAPLGWDPPNGYPDVAAAWNTAGSLVNRWTVHRALVNKWWGGVTQAEPTELVPVTPGMTAGQWVDALALRLLGQPMAPAHRAAVLAFANVTAASPVRNAMWQAWGAVPLFLDSPYFQLR